jgi:uncharacterized glyoxalase superfamily protein PhnB
MRPTPPGWPQISPSLFYEDAAAAIDWLCRAFGFEVRLKVEGDNGVIHHSELVLGTGVIMVGTVGERAYRPEAIHRKSPRQLNGANTQSLFVYVDDVEAHCERARASGATIASEPKTEDYGDEYWADRMYEAVDLGGHHWWFSQRMRSPKRAG